MEEEILYITGGYKGKVVFDDGKNSRRPVTCWNYGRNEDKATSIKGMIPGSYQDSRFDNDFDKFFCCVPEGKSVAAGYSKG